jgi:hypothetical protein
MPGATPVVAPAPPPPALRAGGREVRDAGWGEVLLDTSTAVKRRRIARVEDRWIDRCAADGFSAVDPDNLDSWGRSRRRLTPADNFALAALLIARTHHDGLAIAQKNAAEWSARGRRLGFDFAVAEECAAWRECRDHTRAYGDHVLEIEYADNGRRAFARACAAARHRWPVILRDRDLVPAHRKGHVYRSC